MIRERETVLDEAGNLLLTASQIGALIQEKEAERNHYDKLERYYRGEHDILNRQAKSRNLPNNRVVVNHAKYIADMSSSYLLGNPLSYTGENLDDFLYALRAADSQSHDICLEKKLAIYGSAYELVFPGPTILEPLQLAAIDPRDAFVVYDDSLHSRPILGVYYYMVQQKRKVFAYTEKECIEYSQRQGALQEIRRQPNPLGLIPLLEYRNNEDGSGDFEEVLTLIDAYNILTSDRVNDKEQFVNCLLLLTNCNIDPVTYQQIKDWGTMVLEGDGRAEYLSKTLDEQSTEVLRKALEADIHKVSMVPCLTDNSFAGNSSGVAMSYKMLGFEQKVKMKERFFCRSLNERLHLVSRLLDLLSFQTPQKVAAVFSRTLPVDTIELANMVSTLDGLVSRETLLAQLPFVNDVEQELKRIAVLKTQEQALGQQEAV